MSNTHLSPPSYLPEAIATDKGFAHPNGEHINVTKGLTPEVPYYKPNSGWLSFIDPSSPDQAILKYASHGTKVTFYLLSRKPIESIEWTFGDTSELFNSASTTVEHKYPDTTAGRVDEYPAIARVVFKDGETESYTVTVKLGSELDGGLPVITGPITVNRAIAGLISTATAPTITGEDEKSYQWFIDGKPVSSIHPIDADPITFAPQQEYFGNTLFVRVFAANANGAVYLDSNHLPVQGFAPTGLGGVTNGIAQIGKVSTLESVSCLGVPLVQFWGEFLVDNKVVKTFGPFYGVSRFEPVSYSPIFADETHDLVVHLHAKNQYGEASFEIPFGAVTLEGAVGPSPPVHVQKGKITGTPMVGSTLTYHRGGWTGTQPIHDSVEWFDSVKGIDEVLHSGVNWMIPPEMAGKKIFCRPIGQNVDGTVAGLETDQVEIQSYPVCTEQPHIWGGEYIGDLLNCKAGTWYGSVPMITEYQWTRNGQPIPGADTAIYEIVSIDQNMIIGCTLTVSAYGRTVINEVYPRILAKGAEEPTIPMAPFQTEPGKFDKQAIAPETITYTPGTWTGEEPITKEWRWFIDSEEIVASRNVNSLELKHDWAGRNLRVEASAFNSRGTNVGTPVIAGRIGAAPIIINAGKFRRAPQVGYVMRVYDTVVEAYPTATVAYQWAVAGTMVLGATGETYTVQPGDAGKELSCLVSATNRYGSVGASVASATVAEPNPVNLELPVIWKDSPLIPITGAIKLPASDGIAYYVSTGKWDGEYEYTTQYVTKTGVDGVETINSTVNGLVRIYRSAAFQNSLIAPRVIAVDTYGNRTVVTGEFLPIWKVPIVNNGSSNYPYVDQPMLVGRYLKSVGNFSWDEFPAATSNRYQVVDSTGLVVATVSDIGVYTIKPEDVGKNLRYKVYRTNAAGESVGNTTTSAPGVVQEIKEPVVPSPWLLKLERGPKGDGSDNSITVTVMPTSGTPSYQTQDLWDWTRSDTENGNFMTHGYGRGSLKITKAGWWKLNCDWRSYDYWRVYPSSEKLFIPTNDVPVLEVKPAADVTVATVAPGTKITFPNAGKWYQFPFNITEAPYVRWYIDGSIHPRIALDFETNTAMVGKTVVAKSACMYSGKVEEVVIGTWVVQNEGPPVFTGNPTAATSSIDPKDATYTVTGVQVSGLPSPTLRYQWTVNGVNASGVADGVTYKLAYPADVGKTIACIVKATNTMGTAEKTATAEVLQFKPIIDTAGSVTGTVKVGELMSVTAPQFNANPAGTLSYQWMTRETNGTTQVLMNATGAQYMITTDQIGKFIGCRVTVTNAKGNVVDTYWSSPAVPEPTTPPAVGTAVTLAGTPRAGQTLTATTGSYTGLPVPTKAFSWYVLNTAADPLTTPVAGQTAATFAVTAAHIGKFIAVKETATNSEGSVSSQKVSAVVTGVAPVNTKAVTLTGEAKEGMVMTAVAGTWTGTPAPTLTYAWYLLNAATDPLTTPVAGQTAKTFTIDYASEDKFLAVKETATNVAGSAASQAVSTVIEDVPQIEEP